MPSGFVGGVLDPNSSGSSGVLISGTFQHPTDTKATILATGYFDAQWDKFRRIGVLRIFAADGRVDCDVFVDVTLRTVTLAQFGGGSTPPATLPKTADTTLVRADTTALRADATP